MHLDAPLQVKRKRSDSMATKESNEVRNQLHTIQVENLTPAQISSAAGGVYLSRNEQSTQLDTQCIVKSFQSVKAPTLGALIPNTCTINSRVGDSGIVPIFTPTDNKSYALYAADATNAGVGSMVVNFGFTNAAADKFVKLAEASPGSVLTANFLMPGATFFDSSAPLALMIVSGTAAECIVSVMIGEVVQ